MKRKDKDMIKGMKSSISEKAAEKIRAEKRAKAKEVKKANRKRNLMILGGVVVVILIFIGIVALVNRAPAETPDTIPEPEEVVYNTAVIETSEGTIQVNLLNDEAPLTIANFQKHAMAGHYDGTYFHRIINGASMEAAVNPDSPMRPGFDDVMVIEQANAEGLTYTLSMVLQPGVEGVVKQSFFKVNKGMPDDGGTVFGKISVGQDIVDKMLSVPTIAHQQDNSFDIADGELTHPENPEDVRIYKISFQ